MACDIVSLYSNLPSSFPRQEIRSTVHAQHVVHGNLSGVCILTGSPVPRSYFTMNSQMYWLTEMGGPVSPILGCPRC